MLSWKIFHPVKKYFLLLVYFFPHPPPYPPTPACPGPGGAVWTVLWQTTWSRSIPLHPQNAPAHPLTPPPTTNSHVSWRWLASEAKWWAALVLVAGHNTRCSQSIWSEHRRAAQSPQRTRSRCWSHRGPGSRPSVKTIVEKHAPAMDGAGAASRLQRDTCRHWTWCYVICGCECCTLHGIKQLPQ